MNFLLSKEVEEMKKITVSDVADYLGISAQLVRIAMQNGSLPIGKVVENGSNKTYVIFPKALYEVTGMKAPGYEPEPKINTAALAEEIINKLFETMERRDIKCQ